MPNSHGVSRMRTRRTVHAGRSSRSSRASHGRSRRARRESGCAWRDRTRRSLSSPLGLQTWTPRSPSARPPASRRRGARRRLSLVVFSVGVSTLGAEIAALRLLAPFFGASTIVWANTIATVPARASIGYWLGGTVADRRPNVEDLCRWVLVGACLVALVPLVAQPFLSLSVAAFGTRSRSARPPLVGVLGAGGVVDPRAGRRRAVGDPAARGLGRGRRTHRLGRLYVLDRLLAVRTPSPPRWC